MRIGKCCLLLLGLLWMVSAAAQECDGGNLGLNIFTEGSFGAGLDNILQTDPGIAPGYIYVTDPPPADGFYLITNDMTQWANNYDWVEIQDNGLGANGYMMVVNASFEPGLFYEQEVSGLCENTLYSFSADIFNLIPPGGNLIEPNVSFLIDGIEYYNTGNIPETAEWNTYGFEFSTEPGQTSVTLALQNNAPGGFGNDLALDNISFRPCGPQALILPESVENICEDGLPVDLVATLIGDQYDDPQLQWQISLDGGANWEDLPGETGLTYTHTNFNAGTYYYRYVVANGSISLTNPFCRIISNVKLVNVLPKFTSVVDTLCAGLSLEFGDTAYDQTGAYTDSLSNFLGCDSIVTLNLTIVPDQGISFDLAIIDPSCFESDDGIIEVLEISNAYLPYAFTFNSILAADLLQTNLSSGAYLLNIEDRFGCTADSLITLTEPAALSIDLGPDQEVELGETVLLTAASDFLPVQYLWTPSGIVNCETDCDKLEVLPPQSLELGVTAIDSLGCEATDRLNIRVNEIRKYYIPNIFSPNNDGLNDQFVVFGDFPNVQLIEELLIFDRWGALVFSRDNIFPGDISAGWDGIANGQQVPDGVYVYVARIRFLDGLISTLSGDVTVMR